MYSIRVFTKKVDPENYPEGLAGSVHFALEKEGEVTELNRGYGMLFAGADIRENGTIAPKCVRDPKIGRDGDGTYIITAVRTEEDGSDESEKKILYWTSEDLIHFTETDAEDPAAEAPVMISDDEAAHILAYWNPPLGKAFPGTCFPQAHGLADPVFFRWENKWYFIFTNDNLNDIGIYIREADNIPDLLKDETPMHCILDPDEEREFLQTFWAPEIHVIKDELYILFAVGGKEFGPCCHVMKLKKGGSLICADDFEAPVPVLRKDGSILTVPEYKMSEDELKTIVPSGTDHVDDRYGISLDMTYLEDQGRSYMIWSFRQHIGTPLDSGSMLMIAEVDPEKPHQLISDPVLIARPVYGYENVQGTINNEGPHVYRRDGMIHVNYSGGDARGYLYIINLLSAKEGSDLLDPASWKKRCTPICNFTTFPSVYGPGHNSWFRDESGKEWIAFHAVDSMNGKRIACAVYEYPEVL